MAKEGELLRNYLKVNNISVIKAAELLGKKDRQSVYSFMKSRSFNEKVRALLKDKLGFDAAEFIDEENRKKFGLQTYKDAPQPKTFNEPLEEFKTKNNTFGLIGTQIAIHIPLVPMKAYAQYIDEFYEEAADVTFELIYLQVDKIGKGHYLAFEISGDSMNGGKIDDTPDGATVLAREIGQHLWDGGLYKSQLGHIIITNKNIIFKDIIDYDKKSHSITCQSRNTSPEYQDFNIKLGTCDEDYYVNQIFKVISRHNM